jgi:hypothetical protein
VPTPGRAACRRAPRLPGGAASGLLAIAAIGLGAGACKVYDPSLVGAADAGGVDMGPRRDLGCTTCSPGSPPARPTVADGPDGPEVTFALREMQLNQDGNRWQTIGYDLDGLVSEGNPGDVECTAPGTGVPEADGAGGIDNVFGRVITPLILAADPGLEREVRTAQQQGLGAIVLRVRGWSGRDDDPRVSVVFAQSVFGTPAPSGTPPDASVPDGGVIYDGGGLPLLPLWDGSDAWWVRRDAFFDGDVSRPRIADDNAYVAGRVLVMRLPDGRDIAFGGEERGIVVRMADALLTAAISPDGRDVERAILAGRWAVDDILDVIRYAAVCPGDTNYTILQNLLANNADIRAVRGSGGPSAQCDAISVGIAFTGKRGLFAGLADGVPVVDRCR